MFMKQIYSMFTLQSQYLSSEFSDSYFSMDYTT